MAEKKLDENTVRLLFRSKPMFLKRVVDNLSDVQRQWVVETGFKKVLLFNINEYPQPLKYTWLAEGGVMFEDSYNSEYTDVWRSQFKEYKGPHRISIYVMLWNHRNWLT
ncbi:hypothetical protein DCAR_0830808 [Daucus carota subsp. sativus]|uniref:Uncharacterized protein n=1 Tax=Daucus carota subsp. sativus TaxID=79200 RepID=A0A175YBN0_DAUCS|nr:hypothetical protein DCAR_0830808 [Daucus carota subsp. sativus]